MTNTIRPTDCLVVVLSFLLLGCANNLPELPNVYSTTPRPTQPPPLSASPISTDIPALANEVTFKEARVDTGINTNRDTSTNTGTDSPLKFIANDLVKALTFISGMEPERVSLKTPTTGSELDNLVKQSMLERGYRFDDRRYQSVSRQLTTSSLDTNNELQRRELTAIMSINTVLIKRTYLIQNDSVKPQNSYIIRGVKPEQIDYRAGTL